MAASNATGFGSADEAAKRRILRIVRLNWTLEDKTLVPDLRKPFDVLSGGLVGAMGGRMVKARGHG